tara:strand:+ start:1003 stop:1215 length:213 start_codon:yes stop_codon:yes gene_type:complete
MVRWIAFATTMLGTWLLTNTNISLFSLGWGISGLSTLAWAYFGFKDRDYPRALMEVCFVLLCIRGVINFY